MKTELSHIYEQVDFKGNTQQLKITVDYDAAEKSWTLVKILAIDCKTRTTVDLTYLFFNSFYDQAEKIVGEIDWAEKVADEPQTTWKLGMHPVFQNVFEPFFK